MCNVLGGYSITYGVLSMGSSSRGILFKVSKRQDHETKSSDDMFRYNLKETKEVDEFFQKLYPYACKKYNYEYHSENSLHDFIINAMKILGDNKLIT